MQAISTIKALKTQFPDYYSSLHEKCRKCANVMSSMECELCEDFDMFEDIKNKE